MLMPGLSAVLLGIALIAAGGHEVSGIEAVPDTSYSDVAGSGSAP